MAWLRDETHEKDKKSPNLFVVIQEMMGFYSAHASLEGALDFVSGILQDETNNLRTLDFDKDAEQIERLLREAEKTGDLLNVTHAMEILNDSGIGHGVEVRFFRSASPLRPGTEIFVAEYHPYLEEVFPRVTIFTTEKELQEQEEGMMKRQGWPDPDFYHSFPEKIRP